MADRKGRSVVFKLPRKVSLISIRDAIKKDVLDRITVLQVLGNEEFLVEMKSKPGADSLIEEGFDIEDLHVAQGCFTNVSIIGLRSYVDDEEVVNSLSQYGEIKSEVIRLEYKAGHEFTGIENGNRLVR